MRVSAGLHLTPANWPIGWHELVFGWHEINLPAKIGWYIMLWNETRGREEGDLFSCRIEVSEIYQNQKRKNKRSW